MGLEMVDVVRERGGLTGNLPMCYHFFFSLRKCFLSSEYQGIYSTDWRAAFSLPGYLFNENAECVSWF